MMCKIIIIFFRAMCLVILANGFLATANPQYHGGNRLEQRVFEHSGNKNLKSKEGEVSMGNIIVPLPTNGEEGNIIVQYVYKAPVHQYNCNSNEFSNDKNDGVVDTRENQVESLDEESADLVKEPQRTEKFESSEEESGLPVVDKQTTKGQNKTGEDINGRSGILQSLKPTVVEITW